VSVLIIDKTATKYNTLELSFGMQGYLNIALVNASVLSHSRLIYLCKTHTCHKEGPVIDLFY